MAATKKKTMMVVRKSIEKKVWEVHETVMNNSSPDGFGSLESNLNPKMILGSSPSFFLSTATRTVLKSLLHSPFLIVRVLIERGSVGSYSNLLFSSYS